MGLSVFDSAQKRRWGVTLLLLTIALWGAVDIVLDGTSSLSVHLLVHLGFIALVMGVVAYLWRGWIWARHRTRAAEARVMANQQARDAWRLRASKLFQGLGAEIESQFDAWDLTSTEREVALLLLKGLGHKEIAETLGCAERAVRQRAVVVYRKSGLSGRAALAAFFLEDVLVSSGGEANGRSEVVASREREADEDSPAGLPSALRPAKIPCSQGSR